ncbi:unnamed protein product [Hymenolepis diminuta]|uniref:Uncharacterized protein n=1 Tax=Hymenolepis diminuta TaxID=6216 RepID=A0A3P7BRY8_HYMDI|nr:unnamed protein product [Hymenolepis diminuta]
MWIPIYNYTPQNSSVKSPKKVLLRSPADKYFQNKIRLAKFTI